MMQMKQKELKILFLTPLNELDTEAQTYGCKAYNSEICAYNSVQDVCAFTSDDCICRKPSSVWKKQFNKLKEGEING